MNEINIDTKILEEFEEEERDYSHFYKDTVETIKLYALYVDKSNNLFHIKKDIAHISNKELSRENLISIIKDYMIYNKIKYRLISMLKWNISIEPEEVSEYLSDDKRFTCIDNISSIDTIRFDDSITLFHNLNSLYLVFHEKWSLHENKTKKVYIHQNQKKKKSKKTTRKNNT
jgi:hypothetical protein